MAAPMGVQVTATRRNSLAERVSRFVFESFAERIALSGPNRYQGQKLFESPLSRDKWDHFLKLDGEGEDQESWTLWGQTTCYKGHPNGATEPNKTYEVRETLIECLTLLASQERARLRTVHLTYGDPNYGYAWFKEAKDRTFDVSIYMSLPAEDIYDHIARVLQNARTEAQDDEALGREVRDRTALGLVVDAAIDQLTEWWRAGRKHNAFADKQAGLIRVPDPGEVTRTASNARGGDIKAQVVTAILAQGQLDGEGAIARLGRELMRRKPFLSTARDHLQDWGGFVARVRSHTSMEATLEEAIRCLWQSDDLAVRASIRRILLRAHSEESVDYVQDVNVSGITEHNLYSSTHSAAQAKEIAAQQAVKFRDAGLSTGMDLVQLVAAKGKRVIASQLYFEARNGTLTGHASRFVADSLSAAGYKVLTGVQAGMPLRGYHGEVQPERVNTYANMHVITRANGTVAAILKAKFFSAAEFDRRCKEEGYVGLTLSNAWGGTSFAPRYAVPLVMFVDMPVDLIPPKFALRKLMATGWTLVFSMPELLTLLSEGETGFA